MTAPPRAEGRRRAAAVAGRGAALALLWAVANDGSAAALVPGLAVVPAATALSFALVPRRSGRPVRIRAVARFVAHLLWLSAAASVDVAWRALTRARPLAPGLVAYRLRLADPAGRLLLLEGVNLIPGTLGVLVRGDDLVLHVLDTRPEPVARALQALRGFEDRLAGLVSPGRESAA